MLVRNLLNPKIAPFVEYSHPLAYIEIRLICFLKECLDETQIDSALASCILQYKSMATTPETLLQLFEKKEALIKRFQSSDPAWIEIQKGYTQVVQSIQKTGDVPQEILQKWEHSMDAFQKRIKSRSSFFSTIIKNSWYGQRADFLIESQEKIAISHKFKGPIDLATPLTQAELRFTKTMTACGLLAQDLLVWKLAGLSQKIPHALCYHFTPTYPFWKKVCRSEAIALKTFDLLKRSLQVGAYVGINSYFTSRSITEILLSYGVLNLTTQCASKCVRLFYHTIYGNAERCSTYPFISGIAEWLTFSFSAQYLMPLIWDQWNLLFVEPANFLNNEIACRAYPKLCKQEACKLLNLTESATPKQIKSAYRYLAKTLHPDHGGKSAAFNVLSHAKDLCLG